MNSFNCSPVRYTRQRSNVLPRYPNHLCICIWVSATGLFDDRRNTVVSRPSKVRPRDITLPEMKIDDWLTGGRQAPQLSACGSNCGRSSESGRLLMTSILVHGTISRLITSSTSLQVGTSTISNLSAYSFAIFEAEIRYSSY